MKTTIYLSHKQILALEKAVKNLLGFNDIENTLTIFNKGDDHGSWIELKDPEISFVFWLGIQTGISINLDN